MFFRYHHASSFLSSSSLVDDNDDNENDSDEPTIISCLHMYVSLCSSMSSYSSNVFLLLLSL